MVAMTPVRLRDRAGVLRLDVWGDEIWWGEAPERPAAIRRENRCFVAEDVRQAQARAEPWDSA